VTEPLLREACTRLWSWHEAMTHTHGPTYTQLAQGVVIEQVVCQRLCPEWQVAYERVEQILGRVVRASSAVECLNSVGRMHQARHRHVSQEMLDLKRLYWMEWSCLSPWQAHRGVSVCAAWAETAHI